MSYRKGERKEKIQKRIYLQANAMPATRIQVHSWNFNDFFKQNNQPEGNVASH